MTDLFSPTFIVDLMDAIYNLVLNSPLRGFLYFAFVGCVIGIIKQLMHLMR